MILFNESFAATNEREGSEIAMQITRALLDRGVKVSFVTHLHEFARALFDRKMANALFLRAERLPDGTRSFRMIEGEPLQTSYGKDLYDGVFGPEQSRRLERRAARVATVPLHTRAIQFGMPLVWCVSLIRNTWMR
jgi:DNA mismatch repair ATPase MutS